MPKKLSFFWAAFLLCLLQRTRGVVKIRNVGYATAVKQRNINHTKGKQMKREFLSELGIEKDVIDKIMDEHGKSITKEQEKAADIKTQLETVTAQLGEANKTIESLDGLKPGELKVQIETYKKEAEEAKAAAAEQATKFEFDTLLDKELGKYKFSSTHAKTAIENEIKAKGLKLENGAILGLGDVMKSYEENSPDAFEKERATPPPMYGGGGSTNPIIDGSKDKSKMTYAERVTLHKQEGK
jgi:Phage minor structural protein GP20.